MSVGPPLYMPVGSPLVICQ